MNGKLGDREAEELREHVARSVPKIEQTKRKPDKIKELHIVVSCRNVSASGTPLRTEIDQELLESMAPKIKDQIINAEKIKAKVVPLPPYDMRAAAEELLQAHIYVPLLSCSALEPLTQLDGDGPADMMLVQLQLALFLKSCESASLASIYPIFVGERRADVEFGSIFSNFFKTLKTLDIGLASQTISTATTSEIERILKTSDHAAAAADDFKAMSIDQTWSTISAHQAILFSGTQELAEQLTIDKICKVAKDLANGVDTSGTHNRGQIFLSYRVATDTPFVEKLYTKLRDTLRELDIGFLVWLDTKCLIGGQKWEEGFCKGLLGSTVFVPIVSRAAICGPDGNGFMKKLTADGPQDNVLLEYRLATYVREHNAKIGSKLETIAPICIDGCDLEALANELPDVSNQTTEATMFEHLKKHCTSDVTFDMPSKPPTVREIVDSLRTTVNENDSKSVDVTKLGYSSTSSSVDTELVRVCNELGKIANRQVADLKLDTPLHDYVPITSFAACR